MRGRGYVAYQLCSRQWRRLNNNFLPLGRALKNWTSQDIKLRHYMHFGVLEDIHIRFPCCKSLQVILVKQIYAPTETYSTGIDALRPMYMLYSQYHLHTQSIYAPSPHRNIFQMHDLELRQRLQVTPYEHLCLRTEHSPDDPMNMVIRVSRLEHSGVRPWPWGLSWVTWSDLGRSCLRVPASLMVVLFNIRKGPPFGAGHHGVQTGHGSVVTSVIGLMIEVTEAVGCLYKHACYRGWIWNVCAAQHAMFSTCVIL